MTDAAIPRCVAACLRDHGGKEKKSLADVATAAGVEGRNLSAAGTEADFQGDGETGAEGERRDPNECSTRGPNTNRLNC